MRRPRSGGAGGIDQGRGLQNMARVFPHHAAMGYAAQLVFDHRSELLQGHVVSLAPCLEKLRNPIL